VEKLNEAVRTVLASADLAQAAARRAPSPPTCRRRSWGRDGARVGRVGEHHQAQKISRNEDKAPCIGLIVPPAHGQVPQDGADLYGGRYRFIARGLGIGGVSPEGFAPVIDTVLDRARELREAGAEVISLMGTSISFYRGPEFTESLRAAMQEATGVPCTTMSHAIVAALRAWASGAWRSPLPTSTN
jgi:hypothetical protein